MYNIKIRPMKYKFLIDYTTLRKMETTLKETWERMSGLQVPWMTMSQWIYAEVLTNCTYPERLLPDMEQHLDALDAMT